MKIINNLFFLGLVALASFGSINSAITLSTNPLYYSQEEVQNFLVNIEIEVNETLKDNVLKLEKELIKDNPVSNVIRDLTNGIIPLLENKELLEIASYIFTTHNISGRHQHQHQQPQQQQQALNDFILLKNSLKFGPGANLDNIAKNINPNCLDTLKKLAIHFFPALSLIQQHTALANIIAKQKKSPGSTVSELEKKLKELKSKSQKTKDDIKSITNLSKQIKSLKEIKKTHLANFCFKAERVLEKYKKDCGADPFDKLSLNPELKNAINLAVINVAKINKLISNPAAFVHLNNQFNDEAKAKCKDEILDVTTASNDLLAFCCSNEHKKSKFRRNWKKCLFVASTVLAAPFVLNFIASYRSSDAPLDNELIKNAYNNFRFNVPLSYLKTLKTSIWAITRSIVGTTVEKIRYVESSNGQELVAKSIKELSSKIDSINSNES